MAERRSIFPCVIAKVPHLLTLKLLYHENDQDNISYNADRIGIDGVSVRRPGTGKEKRYISVVLFEYDFVKVFGYSIPLFWYSNSFVGCGVWFVRCGISFVRYNVPFDRYSISFVGYNIPFGRYRISLNWYDIPFNRYGVSFVWYNIPFNRYGISSNRYGFQTIRLCFKTSIRYNSDKKAQHYSVKTRCPSIRRRNEQTCTGYTSRSTSRRQEARRRSYEAITSSRTGRFAEARTRYATETSTGSSRSQT